jgi:hypothetical protein
VPLHAKHAIVACAIMTARLVLTASLHGVCWCIAATCPMGDDPRTKNDQNRAVKLTIASSGGGVTGSVRFLFAGESCGGCVASPLHSLSDGVLRTPPPLHGSTGELSIAMAVGGTSAQCTAAWESLTSVASARCFRVRQSH